MQDLTDAAVARHLRAKAARYLALAEELEGTLSGRSLTQARVSPKKEGLTYAGHVTLGGIQEYLSQKSARASDLAKHFNCSEETILGLVNDPESGIEHAGRGWLRISPDE